MDLRFNSSSFVYEDGELTIKDIDVDEILNEIAEASTDDIYSWIDIQDFLEKKVPIADITSYYDEAEILKNIDIDTIESYLKDKTEEATEQ